jgi:hypothetical protein
MYEEWISSHGVIDMVDDDKSSKQVSKLSSYRYLWKENGGGRGGKGANCADC